MNDYYDNLEPHEQITQDLISSVNGTCKMDGFGMEKSVSVRYDYYNYPHLKAISNLSGNSINIIANRLVKLGLATMQAEMKPEEFEKLDKEAKAVFDAWLKEAEAK